MEVACLLATHQHGMVCACLCTWRVLAQVHLLFWGTVVLVVQVCFCSPVCWCSNYKQERVMAALTRCRVAAMTVKRGYPDRCTKTLRQTGHFQPLLQSSALILRPDIGSVHNTLHLSAGHGQV